MPEMPDTGDWWGTEVFNTIYGYAPGDETANQLRRLATWTDIDEELLQDLFRGASWVLRGTSATPSTRNE